MEREECEFLAAMLRQTFSPAHADRKDSLLVVFLSAVQDRYKLHSPPKYAHLARLLRRYSGLYGYRLSAEDKDGAKDISDFISQAKNGNAPEFLMGLLHCIWNEHEQIGFFRDTPVQRHSGETISSWAELAFNQIEARCRQPSGTCGPAIITPPDSLQAISDLQWMERGRQKAGYGKHGSVLEDKAINRGRQEALGKLATAARAGEVWPLVDGLSEIYEIDHWASFEARKSQADFNPISRTVIERVPDLSDPKAVRLLLNLASNCKMIDDPDGESWALSMLPSLSDLQHNRQTMHIIVNRADYVLQAAFSASPEECDSIVAPMAQAGPERASVWRCQACIAFKSARYEEARAACAKARKLLAGTTPRTSHDRMIGHYLTAIETLIQLETEPKKVEPSIHALNALIIDIIKTDGREGPLLAGLYDALARAIDLFGKKNRAYETRNHVTSLRLRAQSHMERSVSEFCFFDMKEIRARLSQHTTLPGIPPFGEPARD